MTKDKEEEEKRGKEKEKKIEKYSNIMCPYA